MNTYYIDTILATLTYLSSGFILFFIGKYTYQLIHRDINVKDELVEKDNFAFAVAHTGYFVGLLIAIGSVLSGESAGIVQDLIDADRTINVTATDLLMDIASATGDMSINTSVDRFNINWAFLLPYR